MQRLNFDWDAALKKGARSAMLMVTYALLAIGQCIEIAMRARFEQVETRQRKVGAPAALLQLLAGDDVRIDLGCFTAAKLEDDALPAR